MQKRLLCALVGIALLTILCMNVLAAYADLSVGENTTHSSAKLFTLEDMETEPSKDSSAPNLLDEIYNTTSLNIAAKTEELKQDTPTTYLIVNGVSIADQINQVIVDHTTYISIRTLVRALDPTAQISWQNDQLIASGNGFYLTARPGDCYMVVNNRYLYVPDGILIQNESTLAPVRILGYALGASTQLDIMTGNILVNTTGTPLADGSSYYNSNDLHWLSRIISAESKNQPLKGKIAVGTVIMNRVDSPNFADSIHDVIFSGNQFTPVENGSIYAEPTNESIIAAKLVLDGAREAGKSLFFHQAGLDCWAADNKAFVTTIAGHSFYQ